jgi:hypothetical protein
MIADADAAMRARFARADELPRLYGAILGELPDCGVQRVRGIAARRLTYGNVAFRRRWHIVIDESRSRTTSAPYLAPEGSTPNARR